MSEQNKPQPGEWWLNDNGERVRIIGWSSNGRLYVEYECGTVLNRKPAHTNDWKHLPNCTGWDWQQDPEPEWFDLTPFDGHVLRTPVDHVSKCGRFAEVDGLSGATVGFAKRQGYTQFRCLLKDAPPELVAMAKADGLAQKPETYHRYVTPFGQEFWLRETGETREVVR